MPFWDAQSETFGLVGESPVELRVEYPPTKARSSLGGDEGVAVINADGRTMATRTVKHGFITSQATTGVGIIRLAQNGGDTEWHVVSGFDHVSGGPPDGQYRLAYSGGGVETGLRPDVRFIVEQERDYFLGIPLEYWLLGVAALAGWVALRRWEHAHTPGDPRMASTLPLALQIVAWLAVYLGVRAAVSMVFPGDDGLQLDPTVLAIWAGIDLLRLRSGWRGGVIVVCWLFIVGSAIALAAVLVRDSWTTSQLGIAYQCAALIVISFWQYRVLVRPDVKVLFDTATAERERLEAVVPSGSIRCRYCQAVVPQTATACPKCDADLRSWEDVHAGELAERP